MPQYTPSKRDRVTALRRIAEAGYTPTCVVDGPARKLSNSGLNIKVVSAGADAVRVLIRPISKRNVEKKIPTRKQAEA